MTSTILNKKTKERGDIMPTVEEEFYQDKFKNELKEIVQELKPRPKIKDKDGNKDVKVTLRLKTTKEREKLNATAKRRGLSTNEYINFLIKEFPKLEKEVKQLRKKLAE